MTDITQAPRPRGRPRRDAVYRAAIEEDDEPTPESSHAPTMQPIGETGDRTEWAGMDTAPMDGRFIRLTADGHIPVLARWRRTREYANMRWHPSGKWQDELGRRLPFEPQAWRPA